MMHLTYIAQCLELLVTQPLKCTSLSKTLRLWNCLLDNMSLAAAGPPQWKHYNHHSPHHFHRGVSAQGPGPTSFEGR